MTMDSQETYLQIVLTIQTLNIKLYGSKSTSTPLLFLYSEGVTTFENL
jgi:hypothetical protein